MNTRVIITSKIQPAFFYLSHTAQCNLYSFLLQVQPNKIWPCVSGGTSFPKSLRTYTYITSDHRRWLEYSLSEACGLQLMQWGIRQTLH